ncbi:MAG TPA: glycosyltransferase family 2 protein [Candidatus Woesebacteria bacterium]|nr:glycosyltransferase family 2 protein [Candidatus Woesebacteria bacterium]
MRRLFKINKSFLNEVDKLFAENFGLPEVDKQMAIYFTHEKEENKEVHLKLKKRQCIVRFVNNIWKEKTVPVEFSTNGKGFRSLLKLLRDAEYIKATVGKVVTLTYGEEDKDSIEVVLNSFIGDIFYTPQTGELKSCDRMLKKLLDKKMIAEIDRTEIPETIEELSLEKVQIIDDLGIIRKEVYDFCHESGINVANASVSLGEQIDSFKNNYEMYEDIFKQLTGVDLLGKASISDTSLYEPLSIVIPSYKSEATIKKTLASIQSQDLPLEKLRKTEVIIVDDGSDVSVEDILKEYEGEILTKLRVVRLVNNSGLSVARNIGVDIACNRTVLFLDSDVLLSKNYLLEVSVRNQIIPNAVFVAFKENIDPSDERTRMNTIEKGLDRPDISRDMRISKNISEESKGMINITRKKGVEILSETNYFKDFGFGRKVGIFDLPSMVIGHNMSTRVKTFLRTGGFSKEFKGWGMEDSYFGARMVANRNFVIPILSSGVFHVDHPVRSGSDEKKQKELINNIKRYTQLLNKPFDAD